MKEHVLSLPNKLAEEVAEGGDNFSAGQRQVQALTTTTTSATTTMYYYKCYTLQLLP